MKKIKKRFDNLIGFNVAASIKMRKFADRPRFGLGALSLQCGRIYKDAEILKWEASGAVGGLLQCGRIYKDAEIDKRRNVQSKRFLASMWPHL